MDDAGRKASRLDLFACSLVALRRLLEIHLEHTNHSGRLSKPVNYVNLARRRSN